MDNGLKRRAFTLVELLVVIGIIAVLISILLPALGRVRNMAKDVQCLSNMRQIYMELQMYAQDFKGRLPPGKQLKQAEPDDPTTSIEWRRLIGNRINKRPGGPYPGTFKCPSASINAGDFHYSGQPWLFPDLTGGALVYKNGIGTFAEMRGRQMSLVIVTDGNQGTDGNASAYMWEFGGIAEFYNTTTIASNNSPVKVQDGDGTSLLSNYNPVRDIRWRHSGNRPPAGMPDYPSFGTRPTPKWLRSNFLFGDGHAMSMYRDELKRGNFRVDKRNRG